MQLDEQIIAVKGIGEKTAKSFSKLNIITVRELLNHYPKNYDVYGDVKQIAKLEVEETAVISVKIETIPQHKRMNKRTIVSCRAGDSSGSLLLTWFNMPFIKNKIKLGNHYLIRGKVQLKNVGLGMDHPVLLSKEEYFNKKDVLQPEYPLTMGITNNIIKKTVIQILKEGQFPKDYLPLKLRKEIGLIEYNKAIRHIHFPKDRKEMLEARRRIVFDEFFLFSLAMNYLKRNRIQQKTLYPMYAKTECQQMIDSLPYKLTNAQKIVWEAVEKDLVGETQMNRLIQGDVGSGKTVIAALTLLMTALNGYQGCIMVPTEVLARQHMETLHELLEPYGLKIGILLGSMTAKEKRIMYEKIRIGEIQLLVGTHALIQEKVEYKNLGMVITDEQHRFGVKQREALSGKGLKPHILVMSATPIPRTLALIVYGDLDVSVIDELPQNRLPVKNCVVNTDYRLKSYEFIAKQVREGHQAYVICPMVEESENIDAQNVLDYKERLLQILPPSIVIEHLHGKMKPKEKYDIMTRFFQNEIQVLVSTTVIEVGVNVPNATVMMIENAERFGLAQLHQLRGRVGRGKFQSYCIFINGTGSKESKKRLEVLNQSNDGFFIANEDLKLRGPGDMFGIRQSGMLEFKLADIYKDASTLLEANEAAAKFQDDDIKIMLKKYDKLKEKVEHYVGDLFL